MWPDRVSNPGPLTYKSGALLTALRGPAVPTVKNHFTVQFYNIVVRYYQLLSVTLCKTIIYLSLIRLVKLSVRIFFLFNCPIFKLLIKEEKYF